jgi:hypothetical protein
MGNFGGPAGYVNESMQIIETFPPKNARSAIHGRRRPTEGSSTLPMRDGCISPSVSGNARSVVGLDPTNRALPIGGTVRAGPTATGRTLLPAAGNLRCQSQGRALFRQKGGCERHCNPEKPNLDADVPQHHKLGYAQELRRRMGGFSNFTVSFTIISILSGCSRRFRGDEFQAGPWNLGRSSPLIGRLGFAWVSIIIVLFMLPETGPFSSITWKTLNYGPDSSGCGGCILRYLLAGECAQMVHRSPRSG